MRPPPGAFFATPAELSQLIAKYSTQLSTSKQRPRPKALQCIAKQLISEGVTFANTKSKRVQSAPISADLAKRLRNHWRKHGPFTQCMLTFSRVL